VSFQYLRGVCKQEGDQFFTLIVTRVKVKERTFMLDVRKKFFIHRVVRHWNRFPREVFRARLDGALGHLVSWLVTLSMAGELELDYLQGSFFCALSFTHTALSERSQTTDEYLLKIVFICVTK